MALLGSQVLKQRILVPRLSSPVVYYVHSHLQYAGSPTLSQAVQKFDFPESVLSRHHEQTLISNKHMTSKNLRSDNISLASFHHNIKRSGRITGSKLPSYIPVMTLKFLDPLINPTQLALFSLNYDKKWGNSSKPTFQTPLQCSRTVSHNQDELYTGTVADQITRNKGSVWWTVYNYNESPDLKESAVMRHTVTYTNNNKQSSEQLDECKSVKHKCDPLHLATVFQFLREEIPLFFTKGHGYELYHKNVIFVNGLLGTTFRGLRAYKYSLTSMKIVCQLLMTDVTVQVLKITKDSKNCNIKARWRVSGMPRFAMLRSRTKEEVDINRYVDGFSVFEIGEDGLIHCHKLIKLIPSQNCMPDNPMWALNTAAVISLLRQQRSFEMLARHRVEDTEEAIPLFGAN